MKLEKATNTDLLLSVLVPFWGVIGGISALIKGETKRSLTMLAVSIVVIAAAVGLRLYTYEPPAPIPVGPSVSDELAAGAQTINSSAPMAVDDDTRLDGAVAGPGLLFTYKYSMPKIASTDIGPGVFDTAVVPAVRKAACGELKLRVLMYRTVVLKYEYRGKDGGLIGTVIVTKDDCPSMKSDAQ